MIKLGLTAWVVATFLFLTGCGSPEAPQVSDAVESEATEPTPTADPNSMQAIADAQRARESLPGRAHYDLVCAACHNGTVKKAPHKDMIGLMTPEAIHLTLTDGVMKTEASSLTAEQKIEVAEYLAGQPMGQEIADIPSCSGAVAFDGLAEVPANNWGFDLHNRRSIPAATAGIATADWARLKPAWTVKFPGANRARSQPTFAGGLVFVGSHNGKVYALDQDSGCRLWAYQAAGEVRTGIVISDDAASNPALFFGDVLGNAYSIDPRTGKQNWRIRADDHPNATITGTPSLVDGKLLIPVSSLEVSLAVNPEYACCTFRGSVLAVDAVSGEQLWQRYTIAEVPKVQKQNAVGTDMIGPSGAVIWNSPAIDKSRNQLYVGTGENMTSPATDTSDAIIAMDLATGKINWVFQGTANDAWNTACDTDTPENCPEENGPDYDFGAATVLVKGTSVGDLVIGGQKSGFVHALNPDTGALVWQTRVGRGGIQGGIHFGMASAHGKIFVPISDMADGRTYPDPARPGMHALDADTGEILWSTLHEDECDGRSFCHPGISQVPTVIGNVVVAGAMDGIVRAYDVQSGRVIWRLDSTRSFDTILGEATQGGSFGGAAGPVAFDGLLLLSSGYGIYNHMPGNLLLALKPAAN